LGFHKTSKIDILWKIDRFEDYCKVRPAEGYF
jgi:hypothetical protein